MRAYEHEFFMSGYLKLLREFETYFIDMFDRIDPTANKNGYGHKNILELDIAKKIDMRHNFQQLYQFLIQGRTF